MIERAPIPKRMAHLPVDHRGYPVPCLTAIGPDGRARFAVNDEAKRQRVIRNDLCSICGENLQRARWFVGGPLCAFHEHGAYLDPPMHAECARYALCVCPYLALPSYGAKADADRLADKLGEPLIDHSMIDRRPELFVAVRAAATVAIFYEKIEAVRYVRPQRPYLRVEYWRHGRRLHRLEGEVMTARIMNDATPALEPARLAFPRVQP